MPVKTQKTELFLFTAWEINNGRYVSSNTTHCMTKDPQTWKWCYKISWTTSPSLNWIHVNLTFMWPCIVKLGKAIIQLDATMKFYSTQHVSGINIPIIRSTKQRTTAYGVQHCNKVTNREVWCCGDECCGELHGVIICESRWRWAGMCTRYAIFSLTPTNLHGQRSPLTPAPTPSTYTHP
jgi:hypothetical protein